MAEKKEDKAPEKKLQVEVKKLDGSSGGQVTLEAAALGGFPKARLMHTAVVVYHGNTRAGTHATKSRGQVAGSTRKLYRQKGTGRARAGSRKAGQRLHGGIIHGPQPRSYYVQLPKKQKRAATSSAILSKLMDGEARIVEGFGLTEPKTSALSATLAKLGLVEKGKNPSLLIITDGLDRNVYLSARNVPGIDVIPVQDLNARAALVHKNVVFTKAAFDRFQAIATREYAQKVRKLKGTRKDKKPAAGAKS